MEARRENSLRNHAGGQKGQTLIEIVVTLALIAIIIPTMFAALSAAITSADRIRDRSIVLELAQSQMESIQGQEFRPGGGYELIPHPPGFDVEVYVIDRVERCPGGEVILQRVIITVTGRRGSLTLEGFKVRR
jgi:prepilin-type N-terminal cleavage/methylation domain-containing protein